MASLLSFHKYILEKIHDPATSDLLILARGLGLRRVICTLMRIYDSPQNLVLLFNATPEEETAIGEELGIMGCRKPGLRVVGYETPSKDRQILYKQGGVISVTSRILVVDMLQSDIPTELITGLLVLHAERVNALVLEAFIVRLFREKNKQGFVKAFTDQPEHITSGLSPLKNIMKELQLRIVHIYPRFHDNIKKSLERRRADVVELSQPLTELMQDIHAAIIQCMNITLSDLKRSNTTLDLDDLNVDNAYFRSFEVVVRRQLDPVWHKVGPKTKQLINDLGTLRRLLYYLLTYDALQYHAYLETLIAANSISHSGNQKQHQPPWMLSDAAAIIFSAAKRRCYLLTQPIKKVQKAIVDLTEDDDAWAALDEAEGNISTAIVSNNRGESSDKAKARVFRPSWLPDGMEPVLEELPKWSLMQDVLLEIEGETIRQESLRAKPLAKIGAGPPPTNTTLIMTSSTRTCQLLTEFLSAVSEDPSAPRGAQGHTMMLRKLKLYLWWKGKLAEQKASGKAPIAFMGLPNEERARDVYGFEGNTNGRAPGSGVSEALKKKDQEVAKRQQSRRRVRGGAPAVATGRDGATAATVKPVPLVIPKAEPREFTLKEMQKEADGFVQFWESQGPSGSSLLNAGQDAMNLNSSTSEFDVLNLIDLESEEFTAEFDDAYGLLASEQTVLVRAYSDDSDDRMLDEVKPTYIVMCEPDMDFVRRVEVYKNSNPGIAVRVYHMVYSNSCEEHKYLAGVRKEKDAFQKLIKERSNMVITLTEDRREATANDAIIKTISTRMAGGRREINQEPSRVIVDMREFRSTLPSLLHAANLLVIPATLTVGDYILTPDICVERKSLSDLISSFNSGRLYTQCELMSQHYKYPVLLIEFEEDKAFTLDTVAEIKSYAKASNKYPAKKNQPSGPSDPQSNFTSPILQSKIVLLSITFPRLRVIWSSSPYATSDIFSDLKANNAEPDPVKAIAIGADEDVDAGKGMNAAAEEVLRAIPGVGKEGNVKKVMARVKSIRELCDLKEPELKSLLGVEGGKKCYEFLHKGEQ
ncbi:hypothetical protein CPB83DRAFT_855339 [Crepidotus variabilis]|uniref:ERCC4 domain-containing protein n=1 Tax=Crepidotus variabilis TaxID=179855 RepID=A0A9P6EE92_9AGAR|nr:hypothetical protein CPB83DRAFT_855339 [Crepidotus variabilis]